MATGTKISDEDTIRTRSKVVWSFWAVVLLGLPFWWYTTSIERQSLPFKSIEAWNNKQPCPVDFASKSPQCQSLPKDDSRILKYASKYRIVFSLMNEDSSNGHFIRHWDFQQAFQNHIDPTLVSLQNLHNFTIETQTQFYSPLTITPVFNEADQTWVITQDELKAFVNSAFWNLASAVSMDPMLHFITFVPSESQRPLRIKASNGAYTRSNAFLLPQWGGVVIHNPSSFSPTLEAQDLLSTFITFKKQLEILSGLSHVKGDISELVSRRAMENVKEAVHALHGIGKLVREIANMPISRKVKEDVEAALAELDLTKKFALQPEIAVRHSARALDISSRAFFNPDMVGLLYFPDEHKWAVYTPLFGPIAVPLIVGLLREIKLLREKRKKKTE